MKCFAQGPSASGSDDSYVQACSRSTPRGTTRYTPEGHQGRLRKGVAAQPVRWLWLGQAKPCCGVIGQNCLLNHLCGSPGTPGTDSQPGPVTVTSPKQRINVLL